MFLDNESRTHGSPRRSHRESEASSRLGTFRVLGAFVVLALFGISGTVGAQTAGGGDDGRENAPTSSTAKSAPDTEEIRVVVTADRILTDIVSTAADVSIITADEIRRSGAANVVELLEGHPGVRFTSYSGEAQATVDIRGFGEGAGSRVLVLVDGRRRNNPDLSGINWLGIPIDSIERIEIVRSGASALYGNNALGGVINIITKTADEPFSVTVSGVLGSFGETGSRLGISVAEENARLRAAAEGYSTDGYRDRTAYDARNITLNTEFDVLPSLTLNLDGHHGDITYEMPGSLTEEQFEDDPTQATNDADEAREEQIDLGAGIVWNPLPLLSVEVPFSYAGRLVEDDTASSSS
ncbi:MAG: TonB-dependent receptor, partial [Alkalispirochaeta sp.]